MSDIHIESLTLNNCRDIHVGNNILHGVRELSNLPAAIRNITPEQLLGPSGQQQMNKMKNNLSYIYSTTGAYMRTLGTRWDKQKLDVSDYFVEPEIYVGSSRNPERQRMQVNEIFEGSGENCPPDRIVIGGESGYGKTTLCRKIAYDWAVLKPPHYLSRFSLLFFMDLRQLLRVSLEESVYKKFAEAGIDDRNHIHSMIATLGSNVLILLDSGEKYSMNEEIFNLISKQNQSFLRDATIVFTCRPNTAKIIRYYSHRCLYLKGFSRQQKHTYLDRMISGGEYKEEILKQLNLDERNSNIFKCPLMLQDMCVIHDICEEENENFFRDARDFLHVFDIYDAVIFLLCQIVWRDDHETNDCELLNILSETGKRLWEDTILDNSNGRNRTEGLFGILFRIGQLLNILYETGKCFWEDRILDNINERNRKADLFRILVRIGMLTEVFREESSLKEYLICNASHISYLEYCTALHLLRNGDVPETSEHSSPNLEFNDYERLLNCSKSDEVNQIRSFCRKM